MHLAVFVIYVLVATSTTGVRASRPCSEVHPDIRAPCRCSVLSPEELLVDCDRVVFPGDFPALPPPVSALRARWTGLQALPVQALTSGPPWRSLDFSGNSLRRLTDRAFQGLQDSLQELRLADNLLGDNLNPIFSSSEFRGLAKLRVLDLGGNMMKAVEEGILKGCDSLQELLLDRNSLRAVPSGSLNGPRALRSLSLSHNNIDAVPAGAFDAASFLETLLLSHNEISAVDGGAFSGLGRLRYLRLGHNKLTRFNSDVFQGAENLEHLDLSQNFISEVPTVALKSFVNLKYLNLSANLVQSLASANLASLSELETLDLSRNGLSHVAPGAFLGLRRLRRLELGVNGLRTVEDDAFEGLENLEHLSLRDNNILLVPASALARLPRLATLHIDYNRVAALSGDILRAVAARVSQLSLARNVVRELPPDSFREFRDLVSLDLTGNLLATVAPATFAGLEQSLVELRLAQNRLSALPKQPLSLAQLHLLDLSENQLGEIPRAALTLLPSLTYLNLSHNTQLGSIPTSLFHSSRLLAVLDISFVGLKQLSPELLLHSQSLEEVYLRGNMIHEIPERAFHNLHNLTTIDLSDNNVINIRPAAFSGLKNIKAVYLRGNRLSAFKGEFFMSSRARDAVFSTTLEVLDLSHNELSYLFPSSFRVHPRLRKLILADNKFSFFPAELISSFQFLEYVDLSGNGLKSVEELDFARLPRLRILMLARNAIESISESAFHNSTQLQIIDFSENKLERLGERTFEGLYRIEMLDLANNLLNELPESIFERSRLQMLENINLSGNKFELPPLKTLQRQYFFLSSVDLSRNVLREIPPEDSMMVNIKRLDLSFNPLSSEAIVNVLSEPKTVRELNLAGTGMTAVAPMETPFLRKLNLSHNAITELPDRAFERPTLLEMLDVSHNKLTEISESLRKVWPRLKSLQYVDLSGNPISAVLQGDLDGFESLHTLKIHELEQCTRIEKSTFKNLSNLKELVAYGYPRLGYLDVHGVLQSLPALELLDIEVKDASVSSEQLAPALHPRLKEFSVRGSRVRSVSSGALAGLKGPAVVVGLRNTSLTALPPALFFTMPRSTRITLDVEGSRLSTLSPQLLAALDERRGDLTLLGLDTNPILCDCGARALRRWLPGAGISGIRCSAPADLEGQLLVEIGDDILTCDPRKPTTTTTTTSALPSNIRNVKFTTEPDIIWTVAPVAKEKPSNIKTASGSSIINKATPATVAGNVNNDDTLIIGIVGGVVVFIAVLIIVICIVRMRVTNTQYRGGPLAAAAAMSTGHPASMMTGSNGCTCVKPPGPPIYMATSPYGPGYAATLPPKMVPHSVSPGLRASYSTMGRHPYYAQPTPYFIPYPSEEKEHR